MDKITIDLNEQPKNMKSNVWVALKHASTIDPNNIEGDKESFDFLKELRLYKSQYGLGGDAHDLSKWSKADRAPYEYGNHNRFRGFWFF